jgi:hypothetical protein
VSQDKSHPTAKTGNPSGFAQDVAAMTRAGAKMIAVMLALGIESERAKESGRPRAQGGRVIRGPS